MWPGKLYEMSGMVVVLDNALVINVITASWNLWMFDFGLCFPLYS